LEDISFQIYSRADSLVVLGLFISCLPLALSTLVLLASDGSRTLPYGPYPFFIFFCTLVFAWYISQRAHNLDQLFESSKKIHADIEEFVKVEKGLRRGNWVVARQTDGIKRLTVKLVCESTQQLKIGNLIKLDIAKSGLVRQSNCSFLTQLGTSNIYARWWLFLTILLSIIVFSKIEKRIFWRSK
jgi:hypothetical protein